MGSDQPHHQPEIAGRVSIRAPAWGATLAVNTSNKWRSFNSRSRVGSDRLNAVLAELGEVSIRAPAWGATAQAHHPGYGRGGFNSRSRVGSDKDDPADFFVRAVSIRAPAWGATKFDGQPIIRWLVSIRAPAWGATRALQFLESPAMFQFALPRGERPAASMIFTASSSFNSRSRVGSDPPNSGQRRSATRFQFALPRGERLRFKQVKN